MEKEELVKAFNLKSDKKSEKKKNSKRNYYFFAIIIFLLLVISIFVSNHYQRCDSLECFNKNLENCKKTIFAGGADTIFGYVIEGKSEGSCVVNVELLQGELNNKDSILLEKKSMKCYLPKELVILPESDLRNCHGELKEELQNQIIKQLHSYIVQNLGQINGDILDPLKLLNEEEK